MNNYVKGIRYATKLIRDYNSAYSPKDLVHDAIVTWYGKGKYLFDERDGTMMHVIKLKWLEHNNRQKSGPRGNRTKRQYMEISDEGPVLIKNDVTPEDQLISKEFYKNLSDNISEFDNKVLDLKLAGYKAGEIQDKLRTHNVKITSSLKRIKEMLQNPFNGNRTKVIKRVTRKTYDNNPKYKEEFAIGDWSDYNEYYTLLNSKTNPEEGLLIREKDD